MLSVRTGTRQATGNCRGESSQIERVVALLASEQPPQAVEWWQQERTFMKRSFKDLSPAEVLALAISLEEEDARILQEFARLLRPNYPKAAAELDAMRREEDGHRHRLVELFRRTLRRGNPAVAARRTSRASSAATRSFGPALGRAADPPPGGPDGTGDAAVLQPGGRLDAATPRCGNCWATWPRPSGGTKSAPPARPRAPAGRAKRRQEARVARQLFVLQVIQPGLVGLMDGSVSTLAPLFAAAFATKHHAMRSHGHLVHVPGRAGGRGRRGHQHGLRRGPFRRRQPDRPRPPLSARRGLRR